MAKSIFDIEIRLDIQKEFKKIVRILHGIILFNNYYMQESYMDRINRELFNLWEYKNIIIDVEEYLQHIGISYSMLETGDINEEYFLYYLEFILNMEYLRKRKNIHVGVRINEILILENISLILEKMNYKCIYTQDKALIVKRDADADSVIEKTPIRLSESILEYNDYRIKDNVEEKNKILKDMDLFIEKNKKELLQYDGKLYDSIGAIVNKMGVNHPIDKKIEKIKDEDLIIWYDKCFLLMLHAIRSLEVNKIKREREEFFKNLFT